ncbi:MAG: gpW family protein [Nitrospirota bacterium]|nr:gpW family protein [Nitrospirota bacterium]
MTQLATLQKRLDEAETAYHALMTGERIVSISIEGRGQSYTPADMVKLQAYITRLKNEIARLTGGPRRGPVLMRF